MKQIKDLEDSSLELNNIITEMDKIMIEKFKVTFDLISKEFIMCLEHYLKGEGELLN